MTILERIELKKKDTYITIHEAPYHLATSQEKETWKKKEIPCFNNEILEFWKIYSSPLSGENNLILPIEAEQDERRRFIRYPITTLTKLNSKKIQTLGGIWIDNVTANKKKETTAEIHIRTKDDQRKLAYPLLDKFLSSIKTNYTYITTVWGNRKPENDPTSFLKNNEFKISKNTFYNTACLKLK